jgi:hypothetical protein
MDAKEFFDLVVVPNYLDAHQHPDNLRFVCNAITCMNTVAEFVALERLGYPDQLKRESLQNKANEIREGNPPLDDLKFWVETLKHVRKLTNAKDSDHSITASSTAITVSEPSSWLHLVDVLDKAFATIKTFPEFR